MNSEWDGLSHGVGYGISIAVADHFLNPSHRGKPFKTDLHSLQEINGLNVTEKLFKKHKSPMVHNATLSVISLWRCIFTNDVSKRGLLQPFREKLSTGRDILANYYPRLCPGEINLLTRFRK